MIKLMNWDETPSTVETKLGALTINCVAAVGGNIVINASYLDNDGLASGWNVHVYGDSGLVDSILVADDTTDNETYFDRIDEMQEHSKDVTEVIRSLYEKKELAA